MTLLKKTLIAVAVGLAANGAHAAASLSYTDQFVVVWDQTKNTEFVEDIGAATYTSQTGTLGNFNANINPTDSNWTSFIATIAGGDTVSWGLFGRAGSAPNTTIDLSNTATYANLDNVVNGSTGAPNSVAGDMNSFLTGVNANGTGTTTAFLNNPATLGAGGFKALFTNFAATNRLGATDGPNTILSDSSSSQIAALNGTSLNLFVATGSTSSNAAFSDPGSVVTLNIAPVPEADTLALMGLGVLGVATIARRRRVL